MNDFKPIYIWAQAKDNESKNDFYKISKDVLEEVESKELRQNIIYQMGQIVEKYDNNVFHKIIPMKKLFKKVNDKFYIFEKLNYYHSGNNILLKFGTSDRDVANRLSNIDVFLDIEYVNKSNINDYIQFFYNGFKEFCEKTDRHPYDIEKVKSPDFESLLSDNENTINEVLDNLPSLIRDNIMVIAIISIAFIVLLLLTQS